MTTISKHKSYVGTYVVGFADVGECGHPGSGASQKRCTIAVGSIIGSIAATFPWTVAVVFLVEKKLGNHWLTSQTRRS